MQETVTSPSLPSHDPTRASASAAESPVVRSTRWTADSSAESPADALRKSLTMLPRWGEPRGSTTTTPPFLGSDQPSQPSGADGSSSAPLGRSPSLSNLLGMAWPRWAKVLSSSARRRSLRTSRAPVMRAITRGTSSPAEPPGSQSTTVSPPASSAPRSAGSSAASLGSTIWRETTRAPAAASARATSRAARSSAPPSDTVST